MYPQIRACTLLLGQVELRNQDEGKAEEAFQKAVDLDKHNTQALLLLGSAEASRGAIDQAIANYQRGIQDNPRDVNLLCLPGEPFRAARRLAASRRHLQQSASNPIRQCACREQSCVRHARARR